MGYYLENMKKSEFHYLDDGTYFKISEPQPIEEFHEWKKLLRHKSYLKDKETLTTQTWKW